MERLRRTIIFISCIALALFISSCGQTAWRDTEEAEANFQKHREALSILRDFLIEMDYRNVSISRTQMDSGTFSVSDDGYRVLIHNTEIKEAIELLYKRGYMLIGKRNNGIYFENQAVQDVRNGVIYSLDGNIPMNARQHIGRIEPISKDGWFYFELITTPEQDINETARDLDENIEVFLLVKDYLAAAEYRRIIISHVWEAGTMSVSNTGIIQVDSKEVAEAMRTLYRYGYSSISRNDNIIEFGRAQTFDTTYFGIVYSINREIPDDSSLQFLTSIEPLSEDGWFYYEARYNEWRLSEIPC
jgi:hypothetical protein